MNLTERQKKIVEIVKEKGPITGDEIGEELALTRSALRTDFRILVELGYVESRPKRGYIFKSETGENRLKLNLDIPVEEIMGPPVCLSEDTNIHETIVTMFLKDVGSIFITRGEILTGIVSRKDLLKVAMGKIDAEKTPISLVMTRFPNIVYVKKEDSIMDVVEKLIDHQIDSMPVMEEVEEGFKVVGRITKTNITKLFLKLCK
ncbi:MAG: helix-turn-helix transcriptional regulator [Cetobacterium sp.]|uniref:CBS domain-containing protein n=1 Tax=Cetobacterium ceti TaxID=180163 RepID=A0A1T4KKZ8_9FUSO|nr:helix-turn-helix transcriptional regulator [Cetobacterium ceti]MCJ8342640.1 helix-turn-helix transcriptional regulator [Cetobacterium sp.]SJZ43043.1 CBS domain-containing protein [Cetobacterium ceti]